MQPISLRLKERSVKKLLTKTAAQTKKGTETCSDQFSPK
ncbi:unnamed protein product [Arabidopsis halleri]